MTPRAPLASLVLLAAILTGCAAPAAPPADPPSNPLQDVIDLIPWAKSVADDATAADVTARIAELTAALPNLEMTDAARAGITSDLEQLAADVAEHPNDIEAHVAALRAIIADVQAAAVGR